MNLAQRLLALSLVMLSACSLAADFDRFVGPGGGSAGNGDNSGGDGSISGNGASNGDNNGGANAGNGGSGDGGLDGGSGSTGADGGVPGQLSVNISGAGEGIVQSSAPSGQPSIVCVYNQSAGGGKMVGTCSGTFTPGTQVTLTAQPDAGSSFVSWGGDCTGFGLTCKVTASQSPLNVSAQFAATARALTIARSGSGVGIVMSTDGRIVCDGTPTEVCSAEYDAGAIVVLIATQGAESTFGGWGGIECAGGAASAQCGVTMTRTLGVTASFDVAGTYSLTTTVEGEGELTSQPAGISCAPAQGSCGASFVAAAEVTLTAEASPSSVFDGWSGDGAACVDTVLTCKVTMSSVKHVKASFSFKKHQVSVQGTGAGVGRVVQTSPVTGTPLDCASGPACTQTYDDGTALLLEARPAPGATFTSWTGASGCGESPQCLLNVTGPLTVTAVFDVAQYSFTGSVANGTLLCDGALCASSYPFGTQLSVSVEPATGYQQSTWGGDCAGATVGSACAVTIDGNTAVSASNVAQQFTVSVAVLGSGTGQVSGNVPCASGTCQMTLSYGAELSLSAMATGNSTFAGWGGGCSGTGACIKTVTAATSVTATFSPQGTKSLSVAKVGDGTVTSSPAGIACGANCSAPFADASLVDLTAVAGAGHSFNPASGWSGCDIVVAGVCKVSMNASVEAVTATFTPNQYAINLDFTGDGTGSVTNSKGPACTSDCANNQPFGTEVTLTASPNASSTFSGWTGRCTNAGSVCVFTVGLTNDVGANFVLKRPEVTLTRAGGTAPTVTRLPVGTACATPSTSCGKYVYNTSLTLRATVDAGSVFSSWTLTVPSGTPPSCATQTTTGANHDCTLNVTQDFTARANFTVKQLAISVTTPVTNGLVTSAQGSPAPLSCGANGQTVCSTNVAYGDRITLTPTPAAGYSFSGWGAGACSSAGTGACTINSVTAAVTVSPTFVKNDLTINFTGEGVGGTTALVTDSSGNVQCFANGTGCSITGLPEGQNTLFLELQRPAWVNDLGAGHWSGCTPSGNYCVVNVVGGKTVTVNLPLAGPIMFVSDGVYLGDFTQGGTKPPPGGGIERADAICGALAKDVALPGGAGVYAAWLSDSRRNAIDRFADWGSTQVINPLGQVIEADGIRAMVNESGKIELEHSVNIDQNGNLSEKVNAIWTGTSFTGAGSESGGIIIIGGSEYCSDWTSRSATESINFGVGNTTQTNAAWTASPDRGGANKTCDTPAHVICMMLPNVF